MRSLPTCGIYLDKRRIKNDNTYPVKLRVTFERKVQQFKTRFSLTEEDFNKSYNARNPKGIYIKLNDELRDIEKRGRMIIDKMNQFSFVIFENEFYSISSYPNDVIYYYQRLFKEMEKSEQVSSNWTYKSALKQFLDILFNIQLKKVEDISTIRLKPIPFDLFTPARLKEYELEAENRGKSISTISIYLRTLKKVFRLAIREGAISEDIFPFGNPAEGKYLIKEGRNFKRALSLEELEKLNSFQAKPNSTQERAIDFWLLSFYLRGRNIIDILKIKRKDISESSISFIRNKTKRVSRTINKKSIPIHPYAMEIINKYADLNVDDEEFIFPFLKNGDSNTIIKKRVGNFTRSVNQAMEKIAKEVGINKVCSTMVARHTWATLAKDKNINIYEIMDSMDHSSPDTTIKYFSTFSNNDIEKIMFGE